MRLRTFILTVILFLSAAMVYAQIPAASAEYEKLFASAQKYEQNGQWFSALNTWYDCVEADPTRIEAWMRYGEIQTMIESGDAAVWKTFVSDAEQYWQKHFPYVFSETASGIQKTDEETGNAEYVVLYEKAYTSRYLEFFAMMKAGGWSGNADWGPSVYDCVVQMSLVQQDGTVLFNGTPQIAAGRYVFSGLPRAFVMLIAQKKAYVRVSIVAVRNAEGKLVRFAGAEKNWLIARYRPEIAAREEILKVPLKERVESRLSEIAAVDDEEADYFSLTPVVGW